MLSHLLMVTNIASKPIVCEALNLSLVGFHSIILCSICFDGKHCVKIVFHVFQCLVSLEKMIKGKLSLVNIKSTAYF